MKDSKGGMFQSSKVEDSLATISPAPREGGAVIDLTKFFPVDVPLPDGGCEDGLTLSRRSVFTEKLLPATRTPAPRRRKQRQEPRELGPFDSLPV